MNNLLQSEGWQIVHQYITGQIQYHENQLLTCKLEDVIKHRERRDALNLVLIFIDEKSRPAE